MVRRWGGVMAWVLAGALALAGAEEASAQTADRGDAEEAAAEAPEASETRSDPNATRLFLGSTGRPLGRGTGYLANYMLFFPFFGYGITDWFELAGGTPIFPGLTGEVLYLAPRVTVVSRPELNVSAGTLSFFMTREVESGSVGIAHAVATVGESDRAFTGGLGWGFDLGEDSRFASEPIFMLGGELRVGDRSKLITENWLAPGTSDEVLLTGGVRFFGERISADLGLGGGLGTGCCLPVANVVYLFSL